MERHLQKDLIAFSLLMGLISTIIKAAITLIPYYLQITNSMGIVIMGKTIFNLKQLPHTPGHLILSFLAFVGFGALLGIGLSLIYVKFGTDFYLIKGAFYGITVWIIIRSVFISFGMPSEPNPLDILTASISFISHIVYGLSLGYLIVKFNRFISKPLS
jgi:hypothetical protein